MVNPPVPILKFKSCSFDLVKTLHFKQKLIEKVSINKAVKFEPEKEITDYLKNQKTKKSFQLFGKL